MILHIILLSKTMTFRRWALTMAGNAILPRQSSFSMLEGWERDGENMFALPRIYVEFSGILRMAHCMRAAAL